MSNGAGGVATLQRGGTAGGALQRAGTAGKQLQNGGHIAVQLIKQGDVVTRNVVAADNITHITEKEGAPRPGLTVRCGECADSFSALSELSTHLRHKHRDIQVYECALCLKFYLEHVELDSHMLEEHLISDPGRNEILTTALVNQDEVCRFLSTPHYRECVELQCPFCGAMYNKLALYQQHMSTSHRNRAWDKDGLCSAVLKVTVMGASYHGNKSVTPLIHPEEVEKRTGKVYECSRCCKKVYGREPMKRHAATHQDTMLYQCSKCALFFSTKEKLEVHLTSSHLTLDNLNIKQNKHGDMIGRSIDDILNANDCLAAATDPYRDNKEIDDYVDIDTNCTVTHETVMVTVEETTGSVAMETGDESCRPTWMSHKRSSSEDSLPDKDHPLFDMLLLCRYAAREQKRLVCPETEQKPKENSPSQIKEERVDGVFSEELSAEVRYATWVLSVHHLLLRLASLACYTKALLGIQY